MKISELYRSPYTVAPFSITVGKNYSFFATSEEIPEKYKRLLDTVDISDLIKRIDVGNLGIEIRVHEGFIASVAMNGIPFGFFMLPGREGDNEGNKTITDVALYFTAAARVSQAFLNLLDEQGNQE